MGAKTIEKTCQDGYIFSFYEVLRDPKIIKDYDLVVNTGGDGSLLALWLQMHRANLHIPIFPVGTGSECIVAKKTNGGRRPGETDAECLGRAWEMIKSRQYHAEDKEAGLVIADGQRIPIALTVGAGDSYIMLRAIEEARTNGWGPEFRKAAGLSRYGSRILYETLTNDVEFRGQRVGDIQLVTEEYGNLGGIDIPGKGARGIVIADIHGHLNRYKHLFGVVNDALRMKMGKQPLEAIEIIEQLGKTEFFTSTGEIQLDSWPTKVRPGKIEVDMKPGITYQLAVPNK